MNFGRRVISFCLSLALLAIPVGLFLDRQNIYDWWQLRNYIAPTSVARLASNTTMNDKGKKLFYVNHPKLEPIDSFRQDCSDSEQSIVLGCYKQSKGIFVYDVSDNRLAGVLEVTAAHEMLHAAYDRLSSSDRKKIDALTAEAFANLNDSRIKSTIDQYRLKDPTVVPNELHSILGTEVKTLPKALEDYYKQYFTNRGAIVAYSMQYESEFSDRNDKINNYDKQLSTIKKKIETAETSLGSQLSVLQSDRQNLESLLASNNREQYNAAVPGFNAQVSSYNSKVRQVQADIADYNKIVSARNELAKEIKDLVGAIDTRVTPQQLEQ